MKLATLLALIALSLPACSNLGQTKSAHDDKQSDQLVASVDQIVKENHDTCTRDDYRPLYAKSACKVSDISFVQLADPSRISGTEKPLFDKLREDNQASIVKAAGAFRAYGGTQGLDGAKVLERTGELSEKNAAELFDGTISWGDYNKRRKEIQQFYLEEFEKTLGAR